MPKRRKDSPTAAPWTEIPLGDDLFGETPQADFTQLSEEFFYTLPSGYVVPCLDTAEYDLAIRTAKPYVEGEAGIQSEEWVHIAHFVQNVVLRDRTMRELSKPGADRNMARLKELRTLLGKLDDQIQQFTTKRIDPLRAARGDEGESVADWRKRLEEKGLAYAERHIGEHTWRAFCYAPDTEILTARGFVFVGSLDYEDLVAQYWPDGTVDFARPSRILSRDYSGEMHRFVGERVDLLVTPDHRMISWTRQSRRVLVRPACSARHQNADFIVSGSAVGAQRTLTDEERLLIAFQADGSFSYRYRGVDRSGVVRVSFNFSKERKKRRLVDLLQRCEIPYTVHQMSWGRDVERFFFDLPKQTPKDFSWVALPLVSGEWAIAFLEELSEWDSTKRQPGSFVYTTTNNAVADTVQAICALAGAACHRGTQAPGCRSIQPQQRLGIRLSTPHARGTAVRHEIEPYSGQVHCLTVPSGMVFTRRNHKVSVSGNCPEPTCPHHVTPFTVLQERAHWATDPASGPDKIWNEEIGELVHLNYCTKENCDHVAHRHRYNGTLSVEDGARILRISAIGLIQVAMERNFDLGIVADLDRPESLLPYVR